jgi:hypothetical protein
MKLPRRKLRWDELERAAEIERSVPPSRTPADISKLERKILGPSWGRKRRPYKGPCE